MTPDTGPAPAAGPAPNPRYRINPDAGISERCGPGREPREAFFRNRQTGQLYRLGPEECFLLREIGAGNGFLQITAAFRARFFKTVRPRAIGDFVSKMVEMGALLPETAPGTVVAEAKGAGAGASSSPETGRQRHAADETTPAREAASAIQGVDDTTFARAPRFGIEPGATSPSDAERMDRGAGADQQPGSGGRLILTGGTGGRGSTAGTAAVRPGSQPESGPKDTHGRAGAGKPAAGTGGTRTPQQHRGLSEEDALDDALEDLVFGDSEPETFADGASAKATAGAWGDPSAGAAAGAGPGARPRGRFHRPDESDDTTWIPFSRSTPGAEDRFGMNGDGAADGSAGRETSGVGASGAGAGDPSIAGRRLRYGDKRESDIAPGMIRLFNASGLIRLLNMMFGWSGPLATAALYPLTLFAALVIFNRLPEVWADVEAGPGTLTLVGQLVLSIFTANLFRVLCVGVTAHRHGATPRYFGLIFIFYLMPRFVIDEGGVRKLPREGRLAVPAAALKSRLFLFGMGTTFWALSRQGGTMLPELAFVVGQIGLLTFIFTALPITSADGYSYLTTYFNISMLRERAFHYVFGFPRSGPGGMRFPQPEPGMRWVYVFYVVGVMLFLGLILTLFAFYVSTALRDRFGGTGVLILFALVALILMWFSAMRRFRADQTGKAIREAVAEAGALRKAGGGAGPGAVAGAGNPVSRGGGALAAGLPQVRTSGSLPQLPGRALGPRLPPRTLPGIYVDNDRRARRARWRTRLVLAAVAAVLAYVAFLPYRYEVGGDFTILPAARVLVHTGVAGELVEILVDEGDIVEQGQLLARLSDLEPSYELAVSKAELAQAQASLDGLLAGPRPEEIEVARERLGRAEALLPFHQSEAERAETLLERSAISAALAARQTLEFIDAQQDIRGAEAELARVSAPATLDSIALAEARVEELRAQVAYREAVLQRIELRAPSAGRIVTDNLGLELGKAMADGELFAEIENHEIARAEVRISETDIGLVEVGSLIRLRAWAQSDVEWTGEVSSIAPVAEEERFGRVVRVRTDIPNGHGFFRPQMTGRAKIEGAEMRTWEAFTRMFDRFFRIEVWGWIP